MTIAEFGQIAAKLGDLEDYLIQQVELARAVKQMANVAVLETALKLTIKAHAETQALLDASEN